MAGEMNHVLAGSTADLDHIARSPGKMLVERGPERLVIAVKRRRVEATVGLDPAAVPSKLNSVSSQLTSPKIRKQTKLQKGPNAPE